MQARIATAPPMRDDYLVFGAPDLREAEMAEVQEAMRSGWIGSGPRVVRFEAAFRDYIGAEQAVALHSCTAALHLSLRALGVGEGDEVIVPAMTFVATANAVVHAGAVPVLVDCDPVTGLVDIERVAASITPRTRALLPVHMYGRPCDMTALMELARNYGLYVVDDAAHAIEAWWGDSKIGTVGDATCFSFYVTKNITTGEGGMVTTASAELADRVRTLALHGLSRDAWRRFTDAGYRHYEAVDAGYKFNMTDLHAAIGVHQLQRIESSYARRQEIWSRYDAAFADLPVALPPSTALDGRHALHLYTLGVDERRAGIGRDEFIAALHALRVGTGVHYRAVHLQPYYAQRFGARASDFPNAAYISETTVSRPLSPALTDEDVEYVIACVRHVLLRQTLRQ